GVSGLGAAVYSARFNMKTLILAAQPGGLFIAEHPVENYPGFKKIIAVDLVKNIREHAEEFGAELKEETVKEIKKDNNLFSIKTNKSLYQAKSVLIATGSERRKLNAPGEKEFLGKGVSYCASCDGAFFQDKIVGVIGGGDSAAKEALLLAKYAKKVYIIYRKDAIRAEPVLIDEISKNSKIEIINNADVIEIKGDLFVESVKLSRKFGDSDELKLNGLFIEIGHVPATALVKNLEVQLNERGEIVVDKESKTNVPGVFAAGDITNNGWKQAIIAVSQGCYAAFSAFRYINSIDK
ncbi:MAG TPA: thioredoxin reductase, partial [Candidatus Woesearchaeota archaeon]|nr:thioredoxin reductase [Candidatus Woesearchaeota archaeon]